METGSQKRKADINVGVRLKELRLSLGFSQDLMAKKVGCREALIYFCERGKGHPTVQFFCNLCKKLDVNPKWLIDGEKDQPMFTGPKGLAMEEEAKNRLEENATVPDAGPRLRALRQKLGLSDIKMGKVCSCNGLYVSACERGVQKPKAEFLKKICKKLGVNPKWLIDGQVDQPMFIGPKGLALEKRLAGCIIAPNVGFRLRVLRQKLGLSDKKMGKMCSCSGPYVSVCETGVQKPRVEFLKKICKKLDVNPKWLIEGEMDQPIFIGPKGLALEEKAKKRLEEKAIVPNASHRLRAIRKKLDPQPKTLSQKQHGQNRHGQKLNGPPCE